jgi:hypothetical protein
MSKIPETPMQAPNNQVPQVVEVDIDHTTSAKCSKCSGTTFVSGMRIFHVSKLHPMVPGIEASVPTRLCAACGEEYAPKEVKSLNIQMR